MLMRRFNIGSNPVTRFHFWTRTNQIFRIILCTISDAMLLACTARGRAGCPISPWEELRVVWIEY